jgi:hypothetical protein
LFEKAICAAFPNVATEVALAPCQQAKYGDYQCNNAMAIFAQLKKEGGEGVPKNPRAVAEAVVAKLDAAGSGMIASTSCDPFFIRQDSVFDTYVYSVLWITRSPVRNRFGLGYGEDRVIRLAITRSSGLSPGLATGLWRGPGYPEYTVHSKCVAGVLVLCKICLRAMHSGGTHSRHLKIAGFVGHVTQGFGLLYPS